ncbi:MAG: FAD-binding protein [Lentisphaerae bacterium]|nr:FAD-binding protein [Lentisphaerota bacterium]
MAVKKVHTLVIGSGASGLAAAYRLHCEGVKNILLVSEGLKRGTSINTGSDKQTYYKLGIYGSEPDAPELLAASYFDNGSCHGDVALVEAALSVRCFMNLVNLGVPFPSDHLGQYIGYKTDHDPKRRATSCGPYTSKEMCLALIRAVKAAGITVWEKKTAAELIVLRNRACGAVIFDNDKKKFETVLAENTVFAVGGPGGLYAQSVYPCGHTGAIGLALAKGAKAQNLPESQFGLASIKFRWNVSGTYMQVLPRFISTEQDGSDEREFLRDYFNDDGRLNSMVFLKGYQWPFDVRKVPEGSSIVDLLVHKETSEKGRRVFLDFRSNPQNLDFDALSAEAKDYLERSGALFGTPLERLEKMNPGAISLYRDHNIDLAREPLEIAVCSQHNNGGLAGDIWYESTNIRNLFPIGEVNGSHGVARPGGSALNAGQVGAFRAAEFIARSGRKESLNVEAAEKEAKNIIKTLKQLLSGSRSFLADRKALQERMTLTAGHLRSESRLEKEVRAAKKLVRAIEKEGYPASAGQNGLTTYQLAFAHWAYLSAILFQVKSGVGSRGSAAVLDENEKIIPEDTSFRQKVLETQFNGREFEHCFVPCRPIPSEDGWFETVWAEFRSKEVYQK